MEKVVSFIRQNKDRYVADLVEFLKIPSISSSSQHNADTERCAHFVADLMRKSGLMRAEIFKTPGHPIVFGEWDGAPGRPTILVYGHYDVQPVDPLNLWESGPFDPTIRDGQLYARGSADDKGQIYIHFAAVEAHLKQHGTLPVNVKFLIEGEEEVGSEHLDKFVASHKDLLKADVVLISDTAMFQRGLPSICYGLRGLIYYQIDLRGSSSDLHSGSFGGAVANPAFVLAEMLSATKVRGRVTIPGFYKDVKPLTARERKEFKRLPFSDRQYAKELGAPALSGEKGYSTLERTWARPTFEVNGILSGFTGEGAKTVIPAVAMAKVSMRLVPNQDPDKVAKLFEKHLRKICPKTVEMTVTRMHGGEPWVAPIDHPAIQAAAKAFEKGFGKRPVYTREGGSIPVVATFADVLKIPSVLMGIGVPDENAHAPNEKLDLGNFQGGILSSAHFLDLMGQGIR
ncbi:MAG TPA: dipeptidase [Candidatus Polarisedimenticolia bacterium]|jgi:acetylornithine deacetylase/succinyl-diaminopimelate desuccinylase-like protein|nr:dipeptidase [Candidatus Polarisedimenticolia bacterium]